MPDPQNLDERLAGGGYAKKQIFSKDRLVAWSHSSRFRKARELVAPYAGKKLLDHGCGDGTFLAMVSDLFPDAIGADVNRSHVEDSQRRLGDLAQLSFMLEEELLGGRFDGAFDAITCMEVMEHCPAPKVESLLDLFRRLLRPGGVLVVSVPIEIGPSLLGKELGRTIAGWRGIGDYRTKETYRPGELLKMLFAGPTTTLPRQTWPMGLSDGVTVETHLHKGFNWKTLAEQVAERFEVARPQFTPMGWSRGLLSSQAWIVARAKP